MSEAEAPGTDSHIGRILLSQYRIEALIGEGGMGAVYRGVQLSVNRPVAIKLIAGKVAENAECVRRFRREAEAMAKLRHPNTVRLYEFGVANAESKHPELFMVMELLEGHDLSEYLTQKQRLPANEALSIARQTLEALSEAHAVGIVHRDLKPANIFLAKLHGGKLMAKVMDFGIAGIEQSGQASTKLTMQGAVMGTPAYMSPEQAQGKNVDARSDLYSLGVVMFEMLVGKPPFEADSAVSLLLAHVSTQPPKLRETSPDQHHPGVQALLDSFLDKKAENRPVSANAAIEQIDVLLAQLGDPFSSSRYASLAAHSLSPQKADPSSPQATVMGPSSRFTKGYWVAALAIALLGAFFLWPREQTSAARAPQPPKAEPTPELPKSTSTLPGAIATYSVQILSKPAGASVELNGVEIGKTPYTLQFRNPTKLRLAMTGYVPKLLDVDPQSDPLLVVELDARDVARLKPTRKGVNDERPDAVPAVPPQPAQAQAPIASSTAPPVVAPAPAPLAPGQAPPPSAPAGQPLGLAAGVQRASVTQPKSLPPPAWLQPPQQALSERDRRQFMLQRGAPYPNVAAAKRAYSAGQISRDLYEDTIWVLKSRRNERIKTEKLNYKQGTITRDEYEARVDRIDREYEGQ